MISETNERIRIKNFGSGVKFQIIILIPYLTLIFKFNKKWPKKFFNESIFQFFGLEYKKLKLCLFKDVDLRNQLTEILKQFLKYFSRIQEGPNWCFRKHLVIKYLEYEPFSCFISLRTLVTFSNCKLNIFLKLFSTRCSYKG